MSQTNISAISNEIISLLRKCVDQHEKKSDCVAMSGGLDSAITSLILSKNKREFTGIVSITEDFTATDLTYSQLISKFLGTKLIINKMPLANLLSYAEQVIKILGNFNDMEVRNTIPVYATLKKAIDSGFDCVWTGDGADELFGGYSFFLRKTGKELDDELNRIKSIMHFASFDVADALGIKLVSPFLDSEFVKLAESIPSELKVRFDKQRNQLYGKWILRKTIENELPANIVWREKSPLQDGSGSAGLSSFFENLISDFDFQSKSSRFLEEDGVIVRNKESMYYYEIYRQNFDSPEKCSPNRAKRCPLCKYGLEDTNSKFCRMCGVYPI